MPLQRMQMSFSSNGNVRSNYGLIAKALVQQASPQTAAPPQISTGFNSMFGRLRINTAGGGGCGCGK